MSYITQSAACKGLQLLMTKKAHSLYHPPSLDGLNPPETVQDTCQIKIDKNPPYCLL